MITIEQRTIIPAPAEQVWKFFTELDDRYRDWHPEHLEWRTLRGPPLTPGAIWYAHEWVGRVEISSRAFVTAAEPGRYFAYRIGFPSALVNARGSFRLTPLDGHRCELDETATLGFALPIAGTLFDILLRALLPIGEMRRHVREEGTNLAALFATTPIP
jgi:uncharacterized protein YndB with AHSA1/START domain